MKCTRPRLSRRTRPRAWVREAHKHTSTPPRDRPTTAPDRPRPAPDTRPLCSPPCKPSKRDSGWQWACGIAHAGEYLHRGKLGGIALALLLQPWRSALAPVGRRGHSGRRLDPSLENAHRALVHNVHLANVALELRATAIGLVCPTRPGFRRVLRVGALKAQTEGHLQLSQGHWHACQCDDLATQRRLAHSLHSREACASSRRSTSRICATAALR